MSKTIYDFKSVSFEYMLILGVFLMLSVAIVAFSAFFLPNQIVEINGVKRKIKEIGGIGRFILQGIPMGIASILLLFSIMHCLNYALCIRDFSLGKYETVSGAISDVSVTRNDSRGEELYDIEFNVAGLVFATPNSYSADQKVFFSEGQHVTVLYGYLGGEVIIYQIIVYEAPGLQVKRFPRLIF